METLLITTNTDGVYLWVLDNPRVWLTKPYVRHNPDCKVRLVERESKITLTYTQNRVDRQSEATNRKQNYNQAPECSAQEEIFESPYPISITLRGASRKLNGGGGVTVVISLNIDSEQSPSHVHRFSDLLVKVFQNDTTCTRPKTYFKNENRAWLQIQPFLLAPRRWGRCTRHKCNKWP